MSNVKIMNWIIASALMFSFSILQYLILRKLQKMQVPNIICNVALFLPAVPVLLATTVVMQKSLILSWEFLIYIFLSTLLFSYLGNIFSLKGIQNAPNSGYSLIIQKSYAVYTTFAAIVLFGSEINLKSIIAILMVIAFSILIMVDKPAKDLAKVDNKKWILPSFLAFFLFGNLVLASKWLLINGVDPVVRTFYTFTIVAVLYAITAGKDAKQGKLQLPKMSQLIILLLIIMGVSNGFFNMFMQFALDTAPNIGFVNIINTASITPITLFSALIFKESLNLKKIIGIIGLTLGIITLVL